MRKGMNGLALQVQEQLKRDPHAGDLYVFRGKRGHLIKILWHDGIGMSLYAKRLERGRFVWPSPADGIVAISAAQLAYMLDGIDWRNPVRTWRPEVAGLSSPSAAAMWDNRARDDDARGPPQRHRRAAGGAGRGARKAHRGSGQGGAGRGGTGGGQGQGLRRSSRDRPSAIADRQADAPTLWPALGTHGAAARSDGAGARGAREFGH